MNRAAGPRDVVVCAAGGLPGELSRLWRTRDPRGYHLEYGYSCMGYEIAGGLGVKLALPDREVFVMVGDGSYLMMNSEIATSVAMHRKLVVVLLDNRGFGCINRLQQACGGASFNNLLGPEAPPIDFAAHARSLGAQAEQVKTIADLEGALERARRADRTSIVVIETDPGAALHGRRRVVGRAGARGVGPTRGAGGAPGLRRRAPPSANRRLACPYESASIRSAGPTTTSRRSATTPRSTPASTRRAGPGTRESSSGGSSRGGRRSCATSSSSTSWTSCPGGTTRTSSAGARRRRSPRCRTTRASCPRWAPPSWCSPRGRGACTGGSASRSPRGRAWPRVTGRGSARR